MTIQLTPPPLPTSTQILATTRPVEIPLDSRQIAPAAVPPARNASAQRDEPKTRTEREREDRQSGSQSGANGRGGQLDISV